MPKKRVEVRVRIEKCSGASYWYVGEVGKEFTVYDPSTTSDHYIVKDDADTHARNFRCLFKSDCAVLCGASLCGAGLHVFVGNKEMLCNLEPGHAGPNHEHRYPGGGMITAKMESK